MRLRHLIWLYPPAWRTRYGEEFREIVGARRATPGAVIDIVAGAVDAWLRPQPIVTSTRMQETTMVSALVKRCTAMARVHTNERAINGRIMIGVTLALSAVYIYLAARYRGNNLVDTLGVLVYPAALTLTIPFTSMRDKSLSCRFAVTAVLLSILAGATFVATLI